MGYTRILGWDRCGDHTAWVALEIGLDSSGSSLPEQFISEPCNQREMNCKHVLMYESPESEFDPHSLWRSKVSYLSSKLRVNHCVVGVNDHLHLRALIKSGGSIGILTGMQRSSKFRCPVCMGKLTSKIQHNLYKQGSFVESLMPICVLT